LEFEDILAICRFRFRALPSPKRLRVGSSSGSRFASRSAKLYGPKALSLSDCEPHFVSAPCGLRSRLTQHQLQNKEKSAFSLSVARFRCICLFIYNVLKEPRKAEDSPDGNKCSDCTDVPRPFLFPEHAIVFLLRSTVLKIQQRQPVVGGFHNATADLPPNQHWRVNSLQYCRILVK